jgi:hypothetical protein
MSGRIAARTRRAAELTQKPVSDTRESVERGLVRGDEGPARSSRSGRNLKIVSATRLSHPAGMGEE